jgi:DNA-binding SARP family transcriptional activator
MIRFQTLGALDLRGPDGGELRSVLQQPKRLALLAYLCVATPHRFHRRDSLLALFWPELDQDHARAALRRSLHFLRSELGSEVLAGRGDEEVGVLEGAVWCDARALDLALTADDAEGALLLYRGPLLEGLHVTGAAPEFQDWLERERSRLRDRAANAARTLTDRAEADGRPGEAAKWARRVLELSPDETALRRLLTLLDRAGDRSSALHVFDDFARRMVQEFELEPSAETRDLVEEIRRRPEAPRAPAQSTAPQVVGPSSESTRIAILPFTVRGDPRFGYLSEGLVDLLATKLDGASEFPIVDPRALLLYLPRDAAGNSLAQDGPSVAKHFGAGRYLAGSVIEAGGRLQASASLYTSAGQAIASARAEAASESKLFEMVDELARQLVAAQGSAAGTRLTRLATLTTSSLEALKAYLRGEAELRSGRYFAALEAFQVAVQADDSFALAYYRMAASAAGCVLPELARESSDRGLEHRERLTGHDRLVFDAQRAWLQGEVEEAESLYNTITGSYPDDIEAWFHLGDLLFHANPLRGRTGAEAREPLERVLRLQPDHLGALVHLVRVSAIEGRKEEMLERIGHALRLSPEGDQVLALRALQAFSTGDRSAIEAIFRELQHARAVTVAIAFSDVALYSGDLAGAEELARSFIQAARSPELRALCHVVVAHIAQARGQSRAARDALQVAESLDQTWGLEVRGLFASLPFLNPSETEVREVRGALQDWDPLRARSSTFSVFAMHNDLHPAIRAFLLGVLDMRLGDDRAAAEQADILAQMRPHQGLVESLEVELRAVMRRAEGRFDGALALLEGSKPRLWFQLTVASPFFSLASRRYLHAELLRETGRLREAAGWYTSMAERSPYELIYAAPARQRMDEMAAKAGVE